MKKTIDIAVSYTKVETVQREIDFPETNKYYMRVDNSNFFGEGEILFAILQHYPDQEPSTNYTLIRVTRNRQEYTDFVPTKDCRSEYWKSDKIRREALEIIEDRLTSFEEITEQQFEEKRQSLLNQYKTR